MRVFYCINIMGVNEIFKNLTKLSVFFIAFVLLGCDSANLKLNPLNKSDVILAFGDSLTQGVGVKPEDSYPSVLEKLTGLTVINAGISGETTHRGLKRFKNVIDDYNPSLIILLEGGNDILRGVSYKQIESNLEKMIGIAQASNIQLVFVAVPEKSLFSDSAPFYNSLAEKYNLVYEPALISKLMRSPAKKSDSIHFNKEGYADMAEKIFALMLDHGAFSEK